ncbi:thioredoxin-dependent thiol peroxidase [Rickettsiales endosymbiont of Stachyamoeba lipophora]|uniref:thioredoxin-dependent thiol peroxidase n=1 Tax=Rickettsiales endosymbiont of Stachyamoeba lipophora TaxID=2486578 RepID=UPI000F64DD0E|nr:thioredoxin-dependent thiol peroxidase [Rickettsiales endosymbiont of Stachyamoeba lipophora]AZL14962.1 thioredoxin-dependent thiol peroxidase [Rickettsiales endosymbiont of Stachyamoeba lipophora]
MGLKVGDQVSNFKAIDDQGNSIHYVDLKGKKIVLYFYPKDDTPGCTVEAQGFRDAIEEFKTKNVEIIGISKDNTKSHQKFKEKHCLPFTLFTDEDGSICEMFGVWIQKSMFGKKYMGIDRATFIINEQGVIEHEWRKVSVTNHVKEVLSRL